MARPNPRIEQFAREAYPYECCGALLGGGASVALALPLANTSDEPKERRFAILGGESEAIAQHMEESFQDGWDLRAALRASVAALSGPDRAIPAPDLWGAAVTATTRATPSIGSVPDAAVGDRLDGHTSEAGFLL